MQTDILTHPDARRLALRRMTDNSAERTVVFCHPAPGSAAFDPDPVQTAERRIALIGLDRPGYGASDPMSGGQYATVGGAADDIAWAMDKLGLDQVSVAGWSAGGRVALALAARHPGRVDRVVICATPAPNDEVPWVPPEHAAALEAMRGMAPEEAAAALGKQLAPMVPADPSSPQTMAMLAQGDADEAVLAGPGVRERLSAMMAQAYAQGTAGMAADIVGYSLAAWGFEPEAVQAKVLWLYGQADPIAGSRHARWWLQRLPHGRGEMVPGGGHLCLIPMWRRALSHLAPGTLG